MIDRDHTLSITRQAALLGISRGSVYYLPRPVSEADLALMRRIDGRKHVAYASNGIDVIRIELIDTGSTLLAPVAEGAQVEPLAELLARIVANPTSIVW